MNLSLLIALVSGALVGAIAALKIIAPKTATKADDDVLARLEALEAIAEKLLPGSPSAPTSEPAPSPSAPPVA